MSNSQNPRAQKRDTKWVERVINSMKDFATKHKFTYNKSERQLAGYFEIGCFLSLLNYYQARGFKSTIQNALNGCFKYLTSPSGNPDNFSYILLEKGNEKCAFRQQVRIVSHLHRDISFTPDFVVLSSHDSIITGHVRAEYASGKRKFFSVTSEHVIAAHECKSLSPFPELFISFLGVLYFAHSWWSTDNQDDYLDSNGDHLAPCLFVGGTTRWLHLKMIDAMKRILPINIVTGMHAGTWNLDEYNPDVRLNRIRNPLPLRDSHNQISETAIQKEAEKPMRLW